MKRKDLIDYDIVKEMDDFDIVGLPPKSVEVKRLYNFVLTLRKFDGFIDVKLHIFRWDRYAAPFDPKNYLPTSITFPDEMMEECALQHIQESFTHLEAIHINEYLLKLKGVKNIELNNCSIPHDGSVIPVGRMPVSGRDTDFYKFFKRDGYWLPFKIAGYFDLRGLEPVTKEEAE